MRQSPSDLATGAVPGGGAVARLPWLVGRGRAIEILADADDFDGQLAERYGYVNRAIPDDQFDQFVTAFEPATRTSPICAAAGARRRRS